MRLNINIDKDKVRYVEKQLGAFYEKTPTALSRALNRAATNMNYNARREPTFDYLINQKDTRETLNIKKANKSDLSVVVESSGGLIPLEKFKVSPKTVNPNRRTPIKIGVKKGSLKQVIGVFSADVSGVKVFRRTGEQRLPIRRLFGPSVPQMLGNESIVEKIESEGKKTFDVRLEHEIDHIMRRG